MRPLQPAESVMVWYATKAKRKGGGVEVVVPRGNLVPRAAWSKYDKGQ